MHPHLVGRRVSMGVVMLRMRLRTAATARPAVGGSLRNSAILGGAALAVGLLGSSGAWAQCTDNFNVLGAARCRECSRPLLPRFGTGRLV